MSTRAAIPLFAIVVAVLAVLTVAPPAAALHWSGQGTFGPGTTLQGIPTIFTFHLTNAASDSLDVSSTASGACTVTIYVNGQAVNDVIRQTATYQTTITIQGSLPILLYGLIGAIVLIVILVVFILRQRRRPPTARP